MELLRHIHLEYREGTSVKIYEVDLSSVGSGTYVVNFRYGRHGMALREGTKTKNPVGLESAEAIFEELVTSKRTKGYEEVESTGVSSPPATSSAGSQATPRPSGRAAPSVSERAPLPDPSIQRGRAEAILERLEQGFVEGIDMDGVNRRLSVIRQDDRPSRGGRRRTVVTVASRQNAYLWPLTRAVWRAGEMRLASAQEPLLRLLDEAEEEFDHYVILWALAQLGDERSIEAIERGLSQGRFAGDAARLAPFALSLLMGEEGRRRRRPEMMAALPAELRSEVEQGSARSLRAITGSWIEESAQKRVAIYETFYLLDDIDHVREVVIEWARSVPFRTGSFHTIRHLFKMAELRRDPELYGIFARRFFVEPPAYTTWRWNTAKGKEVDLARARRAQRISRIPARGDIHRAWGEDTKTYMKRRIWRTLKHLGELDQGLDYVRMCVGVLLAYRPEDAEEAFSREKSYYSYSQRRHIRNAHHYDPWAGRAPLHHIMHAESRRIELNASRTVWRWHGGYSPRDGLEPKRLEPFSHHWDAHPQALLHLISESGIEMVHDFSVKVLRAHPEFCASLPDEAIIFLVTSPFASSSELGWELLTKRAHVSIELVVQCALSPSDRARAWAIKEIESRIAEIAEEPEHLVALLMAQTEGVRLVVARALTRHGGVSHRIARLVVAHLVGALLALGDDEDASRHEHIDGIVEAAHEVLARGLGDLDAQVVEALLTHPVAALRHLGTLALLQWPLDAVDGPWLEHVLNDEDERVRAAAMRLFGRFDDEALVAREELLIALAVSEREDLRGFATSLFERLVPTSAEFARRALSVILDVLMVEEKHEGVHDTLSAMATGPLRSALFDEMGLDLAWEMLEHGPSSGARLVGAVYMRERASAEDVSIKQMVYLGTSELLAAREAAQRMLSASVDRVRREAVQATRLVDTPWEQMRAWALRFFEEHFTEDDWTPTLLVSLCDSVEPLTQQWGRGLIQRHFDAEDGYAYLVKLSEHPSADMQLFATNYLAHFASAEPEALVDLEPYLRAVLSGVRRGRITKERVFDFLHEQASRSEPHAVAVAEMIGRISATIALGDRARAIKTLLVIDQMWPRIETPLKRIDPEVRRGV